jgi:hypothetical protein
MITHDARWSLSRGNIPVPSPWLATLSGRGPEINGDPNSRQSSQELLPHAGQLVTERDRVGRSARRRIQADRLIHG